MPDGSFRPCSGRLRQRRKRGGGKFANTLTFNGQSFAIKSAFYVLGDRSDGDNGNYLYLLTEPYSALPNEEPDRYLIIGLSNSCLGKRFDLTALEWGSASSTAWLSIFNPVFDIYAENNTDTPNIVAVDPSSLAIQTGTFHVSRSINNDFTVNISIKFADGQSVKASWAGTARQVE